MPCPITTKKQSESKCGNPAEKIPTDYSLSGLIDYYLSTWPDPFDGIKDLKTTIDYICGRPNQANPKIVSTNDGKQKRKYVKDGHQHRMPSETVEMAAEKLKNISPADFNDFDTFIVKVEEIADGIDQFGRLAIYDFCFRKGRNSGLYPEKKVYLQAGALTGAKNLANAGYITLPKNTWAVNIEIFPSELQALGADHIENFLCDMAIFLAKINPPK